MKGKKEKTQKSLSMFDEVKWFYVLFKQLIFGIHHGGGYDGSVLGVVLPSGEHACPHRVRAPGDDRVVATHQQSLKQINHNQACNKKSINHKRSLNSG